MGLFDKMKQKKADKQQAIEDNRSELENFSATKILGIQDGADAFSAILIDEEKRQFVSAILVGDCQTCDWKEKNPWIIDFDEIEEAYIDVDEYWTEEFHWMKHEYIPRGVGTVDPSKWDDVYWCYDIKLVIKTSNPYEKKISFQINDRTLCTQIPTQNKLFSTRRRGLELDGKISVEKCNLEAERLYALADEVREINKQDKIIDIFTHQRPDGILGRFMKDSQDSMEAAQIQMAAYTLEVGAEMILSLQ